MSHVNVELVERAVIIEVICQRWTQLLDRVGLVENKEVVMTSLQGCQSLISHSVMVLRTHLNHQTVSVCANVTLHPAYLLIDTNL